MQPPCLHGLSVWIWVVLIVGAVFLLGLWVGCCILQSRRGYTPSKLATFFEAVLSAAHSDPKLSRLHGRASSSHPRLDLAEAQECCCCFPLSLGLTLLGVLDLARLGYVIAYAGDGIATYEQTDFERHPDAQYAHLMVPHARQVAESFLWPSLIISSIKAALWLLCIPSLCCELLRPLRALLLWLPVDFIHTAIFAANNANFAQELCQVDLRIFARSGYVGVRRDYLRSLPAGPLLRDSRGVPDVCLNFELQEIIVGCADALACTLLTICIAYIGWSRQRSWIRGGGAITNGMSGTYRV